MLNVVEQNVRRLMRVEDAYYKAFCDYFKMNIRKEAIPKGYAIRAYFVRTRLGYDLLPFIKLVHQFTDHTDTGRTRLGCKLEEYFSDESFNKAVAYMASIRARSNTNKG